MHITAQTQQMLALLDKKTLVPSLKEVTARAVPAVKENRVGNEQPMHPASEIRPMRLRHQMKMVSHQHKAENLHIKSLRRYFQRLNKARPIPIVPKYCLPRVATPAEVINRLLKFDPKRTRH